MNRAFEVVARGSVRGTFETALAAEQESSGPSPLARLARVRAAAPRKSPYRATARPPTH